MLAQQVARKYATALFDLAKEREILEQVSEEFKDLKALLDENRQLMDFLTAPQILEEDKQKVVEQIFSERVSGSFLQFLLLLVSKHRVEHLGVTADYFESLVREEKGILKAKVITAVPLSQELRLRLKERLENLSGKLIVLYPEVDERIIGGIIVILKDQIIDMSIRFQIERLRRELLAVRVH
jgi:F-type H+-transporting ATPase subunit delta